MIADLGRRLRSLWTSSVLTGGACGEGLSAARMSVDLAKRPKEKVALASLLFGHTFSDHMLTCEWTATHGWQAPRIKPFANLSISPAASALHYAIECFEGMKAYKDKSGTIRLFRPDMNMSRLLSSATRLSLPAFDCDQLLLLIEELLRIDSSWIPDEHGYSLYIRPTMIGTQPTLGVSPPSQAMLFVICSPVGPYYKTGFSAVSLYCEQSIVRAWPGGTGAYKIGANYAPGILPQTTVAPLGYQQIMWILGEEPELTEVGTMNCFVYWMNADGERELITPALTDGTILPGVTRDSILALSREWAEFKVTEGRVRMADLVDAIEEGRLLEMFGSGTAAVISPIKKFRYADQDYAVPLDPSDSASEAGPLARRLWETIIGIQYGDIPHRWSVVVSPRKGK